MASSDRIKANWERICGEVAEAARSSGRDPATVQIIAVTKRHPVAWIHPLIAAGATTLGENYPQELWEKVNALGEVPQVDWHLIGHLQTNKIRRTLPLVRFVHAVDSTRLLGSLNNWAAEHPGHVRGACLQVNTSGEPSKHGWPSDDLAGLADAIAPQGDQRAGMPIVGLMTIAGYGTTTDEARPMFERLRTLRDALELRTGHPLPHLSMGMSGDFAAAIAEGSTMIRIGSALFEGADEP